MPRSRSVALEGRLMDCCHGLPLHPLTYFISILSFLIIASIIPSKPYKESILFFFFVHNGIAAEKGVTNLGGTSLKTRLSEKVRIEQLGEVHLTQKATTNPVIL